MNEWMNVYPNLKIVAENLLKSSKDCFVLDDLLEKCETTILEFLTNSKLLSDELLEIAMKNQKDSEKALKKFLNVLYKVGLVGFKTSNSKINYSYINRGITFESNAQIYVHKMFHKYLRIIPGDRKIEYKPLQILKIDSLPE